MAGALPILVLVEVVLQVGPTGGPGTPTEAPGGLDNSTDRAVGLIEGFLPALVPRWSIQVALAVAVLAVAWYGSKILVRLVGRRVARRFRRPSITRAVLRSIRASVVFVAVLVAAAIIGVPFGDLVLSVTVLTAAVGVVIAPIISSLLNGLFVLSEQSYEIGDMIEIEDTDQRGFVEDITLRYTKIITINNSVIQVPNGTMRERDVINYSTEDRRNRLRLDLLVTYEGDLAEARTLCERAAREVEGVLSGGPAIRIGSARYPAEPRCYINTFADHGVRLTLRYWAEEPYTALYPPFSVPSEILENIWDALDGADVEMAYPHSHLVFDETSGDLSVSFDGDDSPDDHHRRVS